MCFSSNRFQYFYINLTDVEVLEATFAVGGFSNVKALQVGILRGGKRSWNMHTRVKSFQQQVCLASWDLGVIIWWIHSSSLICEKFAAMIARQIKKYGILTNFWGFDLLLVGNQFPLKHINIWIGNYVKAQRKTVTVPTPAQFYLW